MPTNLNALIRYSTINSCLYGGWRKWSIRELRDACSEALAEHRGRYTPISERTIRDDLRVMRSDILGYNAPIRQEKGLYFCDDPGYSIVTLQITDSGLAQRIYDLLISLRHEIGHPELELILEELCMLTNKPYERVTKHADKKRILHKKKKIDKKEAKPVKPDAVEAARTEEEITTKHALISPKEPLVSKTISLDDSTICSSIVLRILTWGDILKLTATIK